MTRTVYVPADAAALSVGADEVARAISQVPGTHVVRTGSRGLLWLEPLVEVETEQGRIGHPNVAVASAAEAADLLDLGTRHPDCLGLVEEHPYLTRQRRLTFTRVGVVDPQDVADYEAHGGWAGLRRALGMPPADVVEEVVASGLRGRGGAGFPTGIKWRTVAGATAAERYVCVNADEGDSGTFADRMLIEGDPFSLIEGMVITGYAVGARHGYVYLRSEYPHAIAALRSAVAAATAAGYLGAGIACTDVDFHVHVRVGAGAYICGEETSMLESLEGRRGEVRAKPPIPALQGLFGAPTVVNNVLTTATLPAILAGGAARYAELGSGRSRGTQVFQLAGNVRHGGIVETDFGITVRELVEDLGGGTRSGRPIRAVQLGGPLGAYLPADALDVPMDYEALAERGAMLGHGGLVVFDDTVDMARQARFALEFCAKESCGKCTPCRLGSQRGVETMDRILAGERLGDNVALLRDLCTAMAEGSLCAMGGLTPMPVRSALAHFAGDFGLPTGEAGQDIPAAATATTTGARP